MSGRDQIFERIRTATGNNPERQDREALVARMRTHGVNLMPARADKPEAERLELFVAKCEELGVTVDRLTSSGEVPEAVAAYLTRHNLPATVRLSPSEDVTGLPWDQKPMISTTTGAAEISDQVSVTPAAAGIAETGTLVLTSDPATPATLNFVPDNHLVVLKRSQVVRAMEDAFGLIRARYGEGEMPRTVNLVSGPSRTGDVEQKIVMGAHGPRRLHIMLIDDLD